MEDLIKLYHKVASLSASCRMTSKEREDFYKLNNIFNEVSGRRAKYSVCNKTSFLKRVKEFIDNAKNS